jgi:cation diffusion facilitator CzcD-associated flavoprotein CzcO
LSFFVIKPQLTNDAGIDHMPYIPFPSTWPVYIPARKLANWMESYASILELPVWLSANVHEASRDHVGGGWQVDLEHKGTRKTLRPKHVIFAIGWGAGAPFIPKYPGMVRVTS